MAAREQDTIAAISTPLGEGGIGLVRISGPESFTVAGKLFKPSRHSGDGFPKNRHLYHGWIVDSSGETVDEVLVSYMKAPYTYTREDIVEINCHSGALALRLVLGLVLHSGARLAEPGEFTRRAFINGRINLSQAESILNLIRARSEKAVKTAVMNMDGRLSRETERLREAMLQELARIEAVLDFPEDLDLETKTVEKEARESLAAVREDLNRLLEGADRGRSYQEGIATAILGKPNVGKSSLLNVLLRQQRAIVHELPGTTRDLLEGVLTLGGYPIRLIDTAGVHGTDNPVEMEGIERTIAAASRARLLLIVFDGSEHWSEEDALIVDMVQPEQLVLFIINKNDLAQKFPEGWISERFPDAPVVRTALIEDRGVDILEEKIPQLLDSKIAGGEESALLVSMRHEEIVREAIKSIERTLAAVGKEPLEMVSIDLREAWSRLGEITGETVTEGLLDRIFSEFCLGK